MNRQEIFLAWAPRDGAWSPWVKPIAFTEGPADFAPSGLQPPPSEAEAPWAGALRADAALLIDLPGPAGVRLGLAVAAAGFRPVPLFNGVSGPMPMVDVAPISAALREGSVDIMRAFLAPNAPPAFLLDSARMAGGRAPKPGEFDNRWMVFPQDVPSATRLRAAGISRVVVIGDGSGLAQDLARVLTLWRAGGLRIERLEGSSLDAMAAVEVKVPATRPFAWLLGSVLAAFGLRRSSAGGFGARVPEARSGGVGFG